MALICGIDEAGRGPVIGPMVMAGVVIEESGIDLLKELGVKDSKMVPEKDRERLYDEIIKIVKGYSVQIITPNLIDDALKNPSMNLNLLEAKYSAKIIDELKPDKAILDCPSTTPSAYALTVGKMIDCNATIVAEHKADVNYAACSAASILAKVRRDREVKQLAAIYGEIGSGYPSDPATVKFLKENFEKHPHIFRTTWGTYKNMINEKKQKKLFDF